MPRSVPRSPRPRSRRRHRVAPRAPRYRQRCAPLSRRRQPDPRWRAPHGEGAGCMAAGPCRFHVIVPATDHRAPRPRRAPTATRRPASTPRSRGSVRPGRTSTAGSATPGPWRRSATCCCTTRSTRSCLDAAPGPVRLDPAGPPTPGKEGVRPPRHPPHRRAERRHPFRGHTRLKRARLDARQPRR